MEITIKIQSHSGVILFLDSKVQLNRKLHSARRLQKLNGKFHYVNFIKLGTPTVSPKLIYLVRCYTAKNIIWKVFIENEFI